MFELFSPISYAEPQSANKVNMFAGTSIIEQVLFCANILHFMIYGVSCEKPNVKLNVPS